MRPVQLCILLSLMIGWSYSQAPGDFDEFCFTTLGSLHPTYFANMRPIMDSRDYRNLLEPGDNPVWQQVDVDMIETGGMTPATWAQSTALQCRQAVFVCGFEVGNQENWLITQHISRNISGILLDQAVVQVEFEFNGCTESVSCAQTFTIQRYDTSNIDPTAAANISNYRLVDTIAPNDITGNIRQNESAFIDFGADEAEAVGDATGFYLAFRDASSCLSIHRVIVFYSVCPAIAQDLIVHPEIRAPRIDPVTSSSEPITLTGTCVENAHPEVGDSPRISCSGGGLWSKVLGCVCNEGFQPTENGDACIGCPAGQYAASNDTCLNCPANSNSTGLVTECSCLEGFYRADTDAPGDPCTEPPSAPQNLAVVNFTNTSAYLTWEPPESTGGRDDIEYELSYNRSDGSGDRIVYGRVATTEGEISGLTPFTEYMVFVSAENGVSSQAPDVSGRTVTTTVTTEEGVPSVIDDSTTQIDEDSDVVSWEPPTDPGGEILLYQILITRDGENVQTVETTENSLDVSSLGLDAGIYELQIRAVTAIGVGNFSMPITINVNEQDSTNKTDILIIVLPIILIVIVLVLCGIIGVALFVIWHRHHYVASKDIANYQYREQIPLPKTGHSIYVDPTTYTSADDALQDFAMEIPPKSIKPVEEIGAGEFGTVYRGIWKDGKVEVPVAIKTLKPGSSTKMRNDFLTEASIMGQFLHPNVIKLIGVLTKVDPAMIVMEFMENGSLYTYLRRNDDKLGKQRLVKMARFVANGMQYLSQVGYVHRDLAARNVLVSRDEVCKVADFGLSRETVNNEYDVRKGGKIPVRWTAPEAISFRKFTSSSDVWSFGVLLWEVMSYAQHPYEDWDNQMVLDKLEAGHRLHKPKDCPDSVYYVMLDCWNAEHTKRPRFDEIVHQLDFLLETNMNVTTNGPKKPPRPSKKNQTKSPLDYQSVEDWLRAIKMDRYVPNFRQYGVNSINECMQLTQVDLENMGVSLSGHLHKITASIESGHATLIREHSVRI